LNSLSSSSYVLGGECNYLFRYDPVTEHLVYIPPEAYAATVNLDWKPGPEKLSKFLDIAERNLKECTEDMGLTNSVTVLRKQLAVGVIPRPGVELSREQLDEFALSTQRRLRNYQFFLNSEPDSRDEVNDGPSK
jgi:IMP and pyridine-specific 5'-nucleotidase